MNKKIYANLVAFLFSITSINVFSQTPAFDRWDTLYANVDYNNTTKYLSQCDLLNFGNNLAILSDSGDYATDGSYLQLFNTTANTLTTVNFQRLFVDKGVNAGATYSASSGINYLFWGTRLNSNTNTNWGLYNYNTQTNAVNSESVNLPMNIHAGVMNLGFFSPSTNHDSLTIFVGANLVNGDSVWIYRKKYNQTGILFTGTKLPIQLDYITKVFKFNGELFVAGYNYPYDGKLLRSTDGINFTVESAYETTYPGKYIVDVDVMNNKLYAGTFDGNPGYKIFETPDGTNYTTLVDNGDQRAFKSLECYNNRVWYSFYQFFGNKPSNAASTNNYAFSAPSVGYLNMAANTETLSVDTLGRSNCDGRTYQLKKINSRLFLSGNYFWNNSVPGNFIHEFIPPVANFTVASNTICANTIYNFVNQSQNADSVRWILNSVNISTASTISWSFSPGTYSLGLIAISGTQQDTMVHVLNAYTVGVNMTASINACMNNTISLAPTIVGAVSPLTYSWSCSAALTQTSLGSSTLFVVATAPATYTYNLVLTDAHGCVGASGTRSLSVFPNKDITGAVSVSSTPLAAGNVILYKYEPVLTKFDSVTYQPLNALGTFTFGIPDAHTYILKCEPTSNTLMITYAPSETSWKTATVISHGCQNNTNQNIAVVPLTNIGNGPGILAGKITEGQGYGARGTVAPGSPIGGLAIKGGKNPGGNIVAQGRTNSAGEYTLSGLPANVAGEHYFVLVDIPGLDTNTTYHRAITSSSLAYTNLDFVVDSAKINPTNDVSVKEMNVNHHIVKIYPNPTYGFITMSFELKRADQIVVKLLDLSGKEIKTILPAYFGSSLKVKEDLSMLQPGIYIMNIRIGDADRTTKIVITN